MHSLVSLFIYSCLVRVGVCDNDDRKVSCQKLTEECESTANCCIGSCVGGFCNDGLYKNARDRTAGSLPEKHKLIEAELATGERVDLSRHPNIKLLPTFRECGLNQELDALYNHKRRKRIVGGTPYELGKYPWGVSLHYTNISSGVSEFHCGSSLISKRYVLTASHCLTRLPTGVMLKYVTLGNVDLRFKTDCEINGPQCSEKEFVDVEVEDWVVHEGYSEAHVRHDIALIRLKQDVNFTEYIRPICLPRSERALKYWPDGVLTVIGWGSQTALLDTTDPGDTSEVAQEIGMTLVHRSNCDRFFSNTIGKLRRSHICAGGYPGRGDCAGDSGGPLFKRVNISLGTESGEDSTEERFIQYGIVSTGAVTGCARQGQPSVFTSVIYYMPWILDNLVPRKEMVGGPSIFKPPNPSEEFATGLNPPVNVSAHKNARYLPKFPNCGIIFPLTEHDGPAVHPSKQKNHRVKRIIGGIVQTVGNMPWLAQIYVRHTKSTELVLRCGGVLISTRHVLSGAHCVTDIRGPFVLDGVILGNFNRKREKECIDAECIQQKVIPIDDVFVHEDFTKFARENDVAIIRLSHDVKYNRFVQPICIPNDEQIVEKAWPNPEKDVRYAAAGWGKTSGDSAEGPFDSNILTSVRLMLESKKACELSLTRKMGKMENTRVCGGGTADNLGRGECVGDTGGPMLRWINMSAPDGHFYLRMFTFGILSTVECAKQGVPSIYQNIFYYLPWILDHLDEPSLVPMRKSVDLSAKERQKKQESSEDSGGNDQSGNDDQEEER